MERLIRLRVVVGGLLTICLFATLSSTLLTLHSADLNHRNTVTLVPLLEHAEVFERDILNARISFIYYVTVDKPGSLEAGRERYNQAWTDLHELHELAAGNGQSRLLVPRVDALDRAWTAYSNRLTSVLTLVQSGVRDGPAYDQAISEWAADGTTLVNVARDLVTTSSSLSRAQSEQTGDLLRLSTWIISLNGFMCLLVCMTPVIFLGRLPGRGAGDLAAHGIERGGEVKEEVRNPSLLSGILSWRGLRSSSKVILGLGSILALIIVVLGSGISALHGIVRLSRAQSSNMRSEQVLLSAESLRALALAAESDTRGYVFSGRHILLVSQKTDIGAAWRTLDKLAEGVRADPEQRQHVEQVRIALKERFDILQQISSTREHSGPEEVMSTLGGLGNLDLKHRLDQRIAKLESAEYNSIADGSLEADRAAAMSKALIVFAALPASLSLVLLSIVTAHLLMRSKRLQQQLSFQAGHDVLTGLPNRHLLDQRLSDMLAHARRHRTSFAIVAIDLDHFKEVNDRFGHKNGDLFLQRVASRLKGALRQSDSLIRVGGDEFLCLVPGARSVTEASNIAEKLIASLAEPIRLDEATLKASISIGFAIYPDHGNTVEALAANADQALYRAKMTGKNRFCCFEEVEGEIRSRKIRKSLDTALDEHRFHLVYQPQYTSKGDLRGFETLLRLTDPELGAISPAEFIPISERDLLITDIGDWVLTEACTTFARWIRMGLEPGVLAINVSAAQFARKDLPERVLHALALTGVPGSSLELEVTESLLMQDPDSAAHQMSQLSAKDVRFALDDFGTGFSSLSRLHQLPFATIKIDRSFIQALHDEASSRPMVEATLALSKALHVETVGEGVETEAQRALLEALGCTFLQGFLFSRPIGNRQVEELLLARSREVPTPFYGEEISPSLVM